MNLFTLILINVKSDRDSTSLNPESPMNEEPIRLNWWMETKFNIWKVQFICKLRKGFSIEWKKSHLCRPNPTFVIEVMNVVWTQCEHKVSRMSFRPTHNAIPLRWTKAVWGQTQHWLKKKTTKLYSLLWLQYYNKSQLTYRKQQRCSFLKIVFSF